MRHATRDALWIQDIVQRYQAMVYQICRRVLGDGHLAEDIAQDTFVQLIKKRHDIHGSVPSWLHRVAHGLAVDRLRRDKRLQATGMNDGPDEPATLCAEQLRHHIDTALAELDDQERHLLIEHFLRTRSLTDLAAESQVSISTVRRRLQSACKQLQSVLHRRGFEMGSISLTAFFTNEAQAAVPVQVSQNLSYISMASVGIGGGTQLGLTVPLLALLSITLGLTGLMWFHTPTPTSNEHKPNAIAQTASPQPVRHQKAYIPRQAGWSVAQPDLKRAAASAESLVTDGISWTFYDLNGNGVHTDAGIDGLAMNTMPFVVIQGRTIISPKAQYQIQVDDTSAQVTASKTADQLDETSYQACFMVNTIRMQHGIAPLSLQQRASQACDEHLNYLHRNQIPPSQLSRQLPHLPGASQTGARAAAAANISIHSTGFITAIDNWTRSPWNAAGLLVPWLQAVGTGQKQPYFMMTQAANDRHMQTAYALGSLPLVTFPANASLLVPPSFADQRCTPNPVPGSDGGMGCGLPIFIIVPQRYLHLPLQQVSLSYTINNTKHIVAGHSSCPSDPASPDAPRNYNLALFIPNEALLAQTHYQVAFSFPMPLGTVRWSFTTGP